MLLHYVSINWQYRFVVPALAGIGPSLIPPKGGTTNNQLKNTPPRRKSIERGGPVPKSTFLKHALTLVRCAGSTSRS